MFLTRSQTVLTRAKAHHRLFTAESFRAKDLLVTKSTHLKPKVPKEQLVFGKTTTDHIASVTWNAEKGWNKPEIKPYGNMSLDPAALVFHYALACFEGMKAYKDKQGRVRLFRPMENMKRLLASARSLHFPDFKEEELLEVIKELIKLDHHWIPDGDGYSLYIRPNIFASTPVLGVSPARDVIINVILTPVGPYFKEGFKPVKLLADHTHVRAWPGGSGAFKIASNYAPTIHPQTLAAERGYSQILWLLQDKVTEVGTMNLFCLWKTPEGELELITAPLDGSILPGITRMSILELCKEWKEFKVSEREWTIHELTRAIEENRVLEVFGAGTAAVVSPVRGFEYKDKYYEIPCDTDSGKALFQRLWKHMNGIYYGEIASPWSVVIE